MANSKLFMPRSQDELFAALGEMTPQSRVLGGGTDLTIQIHSGRVSPDCLLRLDGVPEARRLERGADTLYIGAAITMRELAYSTCFPGGFQAIADAAGDIGSVQIRNKATIGGNIGNASPAGDLLPVLCLLDARAVIADREGRLLEMPVGEVIAGPGRTVLTAGQAILGLRLPLAPWCGFESHFAKLGFRSKVTIARIGLAVALRRADGLVEAARFVVGAIAGKPVRLAAAEDISRGRRLDEAVQAEIAEALSALIREITPKEFDRDYKITAARGALADALSKFSEEPFC